MYELPNNIKHGIINQALMIVRIDETKVDKSYFLNFFNRQIQITSISGSNGSALKNIPPLADLKTMKLPYPTLEEQKKIGCLLSSIDQLINIFINYIFNANNERIYL